MRLHDISTHQSVLTRDRDPFFFFLYQQFITRGAKADRGSYFVTTYMKTQTTGGKRNR